MARYLEERRKGQEVSLALCLAIRLHLRGHLVGRGNHQRRICRINAFLRSRDLANSVSSADWG